MKLYLVRHGLTDDNMNKILQGQSGSGLNRHGLEQAQKTGHYLKDIPFDIAYTSDQLRAEQTAEEILHFHPVTEVVHDQRLREHCLGVLEGQYHTAFKEAFEAYGGPIEHFRPECGETLLETQYRMLSFFNSVAHKEYQDVLVVSHGAAIRALFQGLYDIPYSLGSRNTYHPANCAVSVLAVQPEREVVIELFNSIDHLK